MVCLGKGKEVGVAAAEWERDSVRGEEVTEELVCQVTSA